MYDPTAVPKMKPVFSQTFFSEQPKIERSMPLRHLLCNVRPSMRRGNIFIPNAYYSTFVCTTIRPHYNSGKSSSMRKSMERNYGKIFENLVVWLDRSCFYSDVVALPLASLAPHIHERVCEKVVCCLNDYNFRNFNYTSFLTFCFFNSFNIWVAASFCIQSISFAFSLRSVFHLPCSSLYRQNHAPENTVREWLHVQRFYVQSAPTSPFHPFLFSSIGHHAIRHSHRQAIWASAMCTFAFRVYTVHRTQYTYINALLSSFIVSWSTI